MQNRTAGLLKQNKDLIISIWANRSRILFPAPRYLDKLALYDALPELIDGIIQVLNGGDDSDCREVAKEHGEQRASLSGYSLRQVLSELKVLRETIFEILEKDHPILEKRDRDIILNCISSSNIGTGAEFMRIHIEEKNQVITEIKEAVKQVELELDDSLTTIERLESEQRLRDLFVATLTHDLKNPLSAAKLSIQILSKKQVNESDFKKIVNRITRSLSRAENMIDSLLDANQMNAGKPLDFIKNKYDVVDQISEIVNEMSELNTTKKINFTPAKDPIICNFSYEKIARAISNLLSNAIKYGDSGCPITVKVEEIGQSVRISVHNEGRAIPPEEQSSIFEPFFRSQQVRFGKQKGWGLGLTLVRGIIEAHGGEVKLASNPDMGTTFSLILPKNMDALEQPRNLKL